VARLLVGLDERNADAWVDLLATHLSLADLQNIYGDRTAAQENLKAASMISQALLKIDGDNVNWLNAASACHTGQAALDLDRGDLPAALRNFQAGLAISQRLVLNDPGSHIWKRNVLTAQLGIGDVLLAQRKLDEALRSYQAALSGARVIARANSGSRQAVTDQVIALVKSADVLEKQGEVEAALQHLQTALPLAQSVGQTVTEWRTLEVALRLQLGTAYGVVGDQQRSKGDAAAALQSYLASRAQFQALSNPQGREAQRLLSLAELAWKIGTLEGTAMPLPERRAVMKQGLDLLMDLQRQGQLPAAQAGNPELFRQALARLN
jgi:tetratricopeptide (TPR) repeat protein